MADQELSLVNKVELRIALAEDDKQFENALNIYLAPVLLKLASPHAEVRQAVLKIIQHVIPRITAARSIKLPVEGLIKQVKTPNVAGDPTSVRLYSTLFISRGVDRLNEEEKKNLIPSVVEGIHNYPRGISARMFNILCKLLTNWKSPMKGTSEADNLRTFLGFDKNPVDEQYLSLVVSRFLMLLPEASNRATPGMSLQDNTFFNTDAGVSYKTRDDIFKVKQNLLEFVKAGFSLHQLSLPLLVASADSSSSINESSEIAFKKLGVELDEVTLYGGVSFISFITSLFLGEDAPPVDSHLQCKILQVLIKSSKVQSQDKIATVSLNSDNARLRLLAIQFIRRLGKTAGPDGNTDLEKFNEDIAHQLRNSILAEGWPSIEISAGTNYLSKLNDVQSKYEALGEILKNYPRIFYNDWSFLEFLFDSLAGNSQTPELIPSIQNALSGLTVHLAGLSDDKKVALKVLIRKHINNDAAKYIAIKFVNSAYPFSDPEARYLSILGTSKNSAPHTIEEALNGLHPYWFNINQASNTTEFKSTTYLLGQESTVTFPSVKAFIDGLYQEIENAKNQPQAAIFQALPKAVEFAEQVLVMEATKGKDTVIISDQDWSVRLEKAVEMNDAVRGLVVEKMKDESLQESIFKLLSVCIDALIGQFTNSTGIVLDTTYSLILARLISFASSPAVALLIPKVSELLDLIDTHVFDDISLSRICKTIGIIASHPNNTDGDVSVLLETLTSNLSYQKSKARILVASYLIARLTLRDRLSVVPTTTLSTVLQIIQDMLLDASFYYLALDAISQLSMFGTLGPVINPETKPFAEKFKEVIRARVKKIDERSVLALGYLTLTEEKQSSEDLTTDEQAIYNTHVSKQVEYVFTSGEALVLDASGWNSKLLNKQLDIPGETINYVPANSSRVPILLKTVLAACNNTQPSLRKAGCIWLLSFVQYCKHLEAVRLRASEIHVAFMRFLADRDELVQESASRGLGLVYEMGDFDLKETLVKSLLKSFTQSNTTTFTSGSVEHDTQLFEPDLLRTNEGSVSTYKDVLNLAQDVGDPSLVYKFMSLAKSSSLWSSRKGIAFGLESILAQSSLDKLLANNQQLSDRLIPKLFRYRYDPNLGVSKSMNDIWNALIKDTSKAVDANFDKILKELLTSMGKKEWRTRQGSTAALNDLLQMVELVKYQAKLDEIWTMSFRVMDDIKESVRKEGTNLTKSLATKFTRILEKHTGESARADAVLLFLIPFLLGNKGLLSDSQEVKDFALETLMKLCKSGNKSMKKYVPELIENFINLFSSLEPEVVNYLVLNASKYNVDHNEIDAKRMKSVGHSPLMDAIEKLVNQLDDSNLSDFITGLERAIKKGVGLPSKVSAAMVIMNMVTHHLHLIKPYGDRLLLITMNQLNDRNDTIASSYAAASGHLCRIAKVETIIKLSSKITQMYFEGSEAGDERSRILASVASESVSKYSGDKFETVSSAFLPVAYIGKFDSNKQVVSNFEREWIENTSGGNSAIKLYLVEIIELVKKYLKSNEFSIRKTLAKALSNLCLVIDNLNQFSTAIIDEILQLLIESNKGKSWDGKELVFESLVSFAIMSKSYIDHHEEIYEAINKTVTVEVKRRNKTYQKQAILTCGKYIHTFHQDDELVDLYIEIMTKVLSDKYETTDDDDDDDMEDGESKKLNTKENIEWEDNKLKVLQNLSVAFYTTPDISTELYNFTFEQLVEVFKSKIIENTWRSKLQTTEIFKKVLTEVEESDQEVDTDVLVNTWGFLKDKSLIVESIENVKIQFIRLSKQLNDYLKKANKPTPAISQALDEFATKETSNVVLTELRKN
ncbi:Proteasome component ECM29 [Candida viswanathii]|uniref:Proteasome component ECM29 n=1 Tax=Candida viswanathii TaxID=5486 RepID=A0A367YEX1_9ASCO|nr:Proteasome component ECM29 [Candida viswanathii]